MSDDGDLTFEQVWDFTRRVSSVAAYSKEEGEVLFGLAMELRPGARIVEVGCEYGRSTSILAQVAKAHGIRLELVDPFLTYEGKPGPKLVEMLIKLRAPFTLHCMNSTMADVGKIDLLHIDGDHSADGVERDCAGYLPQVVPGGMVCFHDYGRDSLPDVYKTVNRVMGAEAGMPGSYGSYGWRQVMVVGTLGVFRKKWR